MKKITAQLRAMCLVPMEEVRKFIDWAWEFRGKNSLDRNVLGYPRAVMASAHDENGPIMFIPCQPVLMYESLVPKPGLTNRQVALGLWRIGEQGDKAMLDTGIREAYFLTTSDREAEVTALHGWEEVTGFRMMKRKLGNTIPAPNVEASDE